MESIRAIAGFAARKPRTQPAVKKEARDRNSIRARHCVFVRGRFTNDISIRILFGRAAGDQTLETHDAKDDHQKSLVPLFLYVAQPW